MFLLNSSRDVKNIEPNKAEWENTEYETEILAMVDWQNLFYNQIINIPELSSFYIDKMEQLDSILERTEWQDRISKRGLGFLSIINKLETFIEKKVMLSKNMSLSQVPGMKIIIESLNFELSNTNVAQYSDSLIKLLRIFIKDQQIINKFFKTIISKTK